MTLLVLCALCTHRGKYTGVHEITYPAWLLQRYEGDGFAFVD